MDLVYCDYSPGVQFLNCVEAIGIEGGENKFTDGFRLAEIIRRDHPEEWKTLTQKCLDFQDIGYEEAAGEFHKLTTRPVFE